MNHPEDIQHWIDTTSLAKKLPQAQTKKENPIMNQREVLYLISGIIIGLGLAILVVFVLNFE